MSKTNNKNSLFILLLTHPTLRVFRHLILLTLLFVIFSGLLWINLESISASPVEKHIGLAFFFIGIFGGSYLNIYFLVPRLLMKNKWKRYFCSLFGIVASLVLVILLMQTTFFRINIFKLNLDWFFYFRFILNLISATLSFFLLFIGTTTFVVFKYWIQDMQQSAELESVTMQMEIKLLENQINPHFLFNMLNNANIMIKKDADVAIHIIEKLEEMLRYLMDKTALEKVYLKEEISFLNDFLNMEKSRRDYFNYTITKEGDAEDIQIAPLLFIAFVENAVKHSLNSHATSYVNISFNVSNNMVIFVCDNSIPENPPVKKAGGVGLANIKRRLDLLYNNNYSLEQVKTNTTYTVKLELNL